LAPSPFRIAKYGLAAAGSTAGLRNMMPARLPAFDYHDNDDNDDYSPFLDIYTR